MSLAMCAAPFDEGFDDNNNNNDNLINKKRQTHNKTQKMYNKESYTPMKNFDKNKVNSVLEEIHNKTEADDSNSEMANFYPPPKPESAGVQRTLTNEAMQNMTNENNMNMYKVLGKAPDPINDDNNLELNNYRMNYGDNKSIDDYYKKMLPNMNAVFQKNPVNKQYYNNDIK